MKPAALYELGGIPIDRAALRSINPGFEYTPQVDPRGHLIFDTPPPKTPINSKRWKNPESDITGKKTGRLTAMWYWGRRPGKNRGACSHLWLFRCDCGRYTVRRAAIMKHQCNLNMCRFCTHNEYLKRQAQ